MAEAKTARVAAEVVRGAAHVLEGARGDYNPLLKLIGVSRFALLGEASHGTHEFYRERAEVTKRLIEERGFTAVAVEADWPDAYRVNRYVRGESEDGAPEPLLPRAARRAVRCCSTLRRDEGRRASGAGAQWHAGDEPPETYPSGI